MMDFFIRGGYAMLPLIAIALVVVALALRSWLRIDGDSIPLAIRSRLRIGGDSILPDAVVETGIDAIAFWGAYGVVIGLLGTLIGIASAASAIHLAGDVTTALLWGGIGISLNPTIFGLVIFSVSLVLWFGLRMRYRRRAAAEETALA